MTSCTAPLFCTIVILNVVKDIAHILRFTQDDRIVFQKPTERASPWARDKNQIAKRRRSDLRLEFLLLIPKMIDNIPRVVVG